MGVFLSKIFRIANWFSGRRNLISEVGKSSPIFKLSLWKPSCSDNELMENYIDAEIGNYAILDMEQIEDI